MYFHFFMLRKLVATILVCATLTVAFHPSTTRPPFLKPLFSTMASDNGRMLSIVTPDNVSLEIKDPVDPIALGQAKAILDELRPDGGKVDETKLLEVAKRLGDLTDGPYIVPKEDCKAAFDGLTEQERTSLINIHSRVKTFAEAQRKSVVDLEIDIPGGKAGHTVSPCKGE